MWQNRELGEFAPAWDPGTRHSPNTLFAAAMAQGGFALQIPSPELYYELLPAHHVMIHGRRGVKIRGLWYDGPALDAYRDGPSARGGVHKGKWVIRSDPRDRRLAYFRDPLTRDWHALRWAGLPPAGEVPCFGDARAQELLRAARARGLQPRTDAELLPLLLELIGGHLPVGSWPTQMPRKKRTEHAREVLQGQAAAADKPAGPPAAASPPSGGDTVVPLRRNDRAGEVARAVDDERRRRREQVMASRPVTVPPRLGDRLRRDSPFVLPEDDTAAGFPGAGADGEAAR